MADQCSNTFTMADHVVTRREPHVTVPVGDPNPPTHTLPAPTPKPVQIVKPSPSKPRVTLTTLYKNLFLKHLKQEYWAYIALIALTCLYTGIMVAVFGFSDILDPSNGQVEWLGLFLILVGVALLLTSGIFYHRKNRRLRPCICCGVDLDDTPELPIRNKKRLRFAPNLISPYYEVAKKQQAEREATILLTPPPVEELQPEQENSMTLTTSPVVKLQQEIQMVETESGDSSMGSTAALITKERKGSKVTLC